MGNNTCFTMVNLCLFSSRLPSLTGLWLLSFYSSSPSVFLKVSLPSISIPKYLTSILYRMSSPSIVMFMSVLLNLWRSMTSVVSGFMTLSSSLYTIFFSLSLFRWSFAVTRTSCCYCDAVAASSAYLARVFVSYKMSAFWMSAVKMGYNLGESTLW